MVKWSSIDTVLLDMDGVLLDLAFDNWFWREHVPACYATLRGMSAEEAKNQVFPKMKAISGTLNWYSVKYWSRTLGLDIVDLKQQAANRIRLRPQVLDFLDSCVRMGKRIDLATNAHPLTIEIKFIKTDLGRYFDNVISSHDIGSPKEQLEFWVKIRDRYQLDLSRSLFIDDNVDVLRAAQESGVSQILSVSQPDSTEPERFPAGISVIRSFSEIMPGPC